jgi:hypothetical protein
MANPWLKKNPLMSMWLSSANAAGAREASLRRRQANSILSLQNRPSDFGSALGSLRLSQRVTVNILARQTPGIAWGQLRGEGMGAMSREGRHDREVLAQLDDGS